MDESDVIKLIAGATPVINYVYLVLDRNYHVINSFQNIVDAIHYYTSKDKTAFLVKVPFNATSKEAKQLISKKAEPDFLLELNSEDGLLTFKQIEKMRKDETDLLILKAKRYSKISILMTIIIMVPLFLWSLNFVQNKVITFNFAMNMWGTVSLIAGLVSLTAIFSTTKAYQDFIFFVKKKFKKQKKVKKD